MGAKLSSPSGHGSRFYGNSPLKRKVGLFDLVSSSTSYSPEMYRDDEFGKIPENQYVRDVSRAQTRGQYMRFLSRQYQFQKTGKYSSAGETSVIYFRQGYADSPPSHRIYTVNLSGVSQDVSYHDVLEHFRATSSTASLINMKVNYDNARQYWKSQKVDVDYDDDDGKFQNEKYKRTDRYQSYVDMKYTDADMKFHAVTQELSTRKRVITTRENRRRLKKEGERK